METVSDRFIIPAMAIGWAILLGVGLVLFDLPLEWLVAGAIGVVILMVVGTLPTQWLVLSLIGAAMFINVANYSFLTFSAEGEFARGSESTAIAVLRLPIVFFVLVIIFRRYGAVFGAFLRKNWDVLFFCFVTFLGIPFAPDAVHAGQYALWTTLTLAAILGLMHVLRAEVPWWQWSEYLGWLLLVSSGIMVLFALFGLPETLSGANMGAVQASYGSAYIYSLFCSVVLASVLVVERQKSYGFASRLLRRIPVPAILVVSVLTVVPLLFSGKRSAILTAGLVIAVYLLAGLMRGSPKRSTGIVRAFLLAGVLAGAVWVFLPKAEFTLFRFGKTLNPDQNASVSTRIEVIERGIVAFKENPIFGVGIDNGKNVVGFGLHNTYLGVLLETGIFGAVLFLIIVGRSLGSWLKMHPSVRVAVVLFAIPPVLISATEYTGAPGQAMFWPLWIAILAPRLVIDSASVNITASEDGRANA